jgi:hypothetical protein
MQIGRMHALLRQIGHCILTLDAKGCLLFQQVVHPYPSEATTGQVALLDTNYSCFTPV